jgi:cyclophilin family peptidyl-prolyl cis-trans isomerase
MNKPLVEFQTNLGRFVIEVATDKAPKSAENFLGYVDAKHYDGTVFHRVIKGFMAQGGGFDASFSKKATRPPVPNEADNGVKNTRGTVAMARTSDPHSATSQFFVNLVENGFLDHTGKNDRGWGYTVFGRVTEGMDVVDKMADQRTGAKGPFDKDAPQQDIVIQSARRI